MNDKDRPDSSKTTEATDRTDSGSAAPQQDRSPPPSSPPPRGPSLKLIAGLLAVALGGIWIGGAWGGQLKSGFLRIWESFASADENEDDSATDTAQRTYYTCGMHPWVILPKPGLCPICHMDLTPLDPAKFTGEISIDPRVVQSIGVRVAPVVTGPLVRSIRTVGTVDYDETAVRDVNIKVKGWIEKLHVDYLGAQVKEGEPLFELYSPELYDTQQQYLLAFRNRDQKEVPFLPGAGKDPQRLLESSRIRLEYYDITPEQIDKLEKSGNPSKTMVIKSPHTGVVIAKHANEGMLVDPGMQVYRIADLSKLWVLVTLYEYQQPYVSVGQRAVMTLPYIPGQTFEGKVIYIYPYLQKETREIQVRLEFDNPNTILKPGMFANVELKSTLAAERTLAPRAAVIDTGERQVAFVSLGDGRFEPRNILLGIETEGGMVEVLDGLRPGEMVVTSAQFLLDSESKIREALAKMIKGDLASEQKAVAPLAGTSELKSLPDEVARALREVLDGYFTIGDGLAGDRTEEIAAAARKVAAGLDTLLGLEVPEDPHFWHKHTEAATVRGKALELVGERELEGARLKFSDLSIALAKLIKATGVPASYGREVQELHCPMYREGQGGGSWLQTEGSVRNPFFGSTMLRCFDARAVLPVTGGMVSGGTEKAEASQEPDAPLPAQSQEQDGKEVQDGKEEQEHHEHETAASGETQSPPEKESASGGPIATREETLVAILDGYFEIGDRLAGDSAQGIGESAERIAGSLVALVKTPVPDDEHFWHKHTETASARETALALAKVSGLAEARALYADLGAALSRLVRATGVPQAHEGEIEEFHCSMYRGREGGGTWLQPEGLARNPFFGSAMLRCHTKRETLPRASTSPESGQPASATEAQDHSGHQGSHAREGSEP